jgi:glutathione S-transferase
MAETILTISSKNYSSWSLRGWLLCRMAGLEFVEEMMPSDNPSIRAELMLLSPSFLVPRLTHQGVRVWDTLAIAEFLHELYPDAQLLPSKLAERTLCRSIAGEMHSGFANLRSSLPMNLKAHYPGFKIWAGAQADIDRVTEIWRDCLKNYDGPYLFGARPTMADAMYAPVCTRFRTYDVKLDRLCSDYCETILGLPDMLEWLEGSRAEVDEVEGLEAEF